MKLVELLKDVEVLECTAPNHTEITGVCCDSRKARPGYLFVAVRGTHDQGLNHLEQALARGVAAVAAESPPPPSGIGWIRVRDARAALGALACAIHGHPSRSMEVHVITGTNGKTTTAWLTRDILEISGRKTGLISTVEYTYGERVISASRTTPDACDLQELLAAMRDDGCVAAVMEGSSHALDQQRIGGMRLASAAFTNLSRDHLDYHRDFDRYFAAKLRLFTQLAQTHPGAPAIVNREDPYGLKLLDMLGNLSLHAITYGCDDRSEIRAEDIRLDASGSRFRLCTPQGSTPVATRLLGRCNVQNMLCAAGLAHAAGVPLDRMAAALERSEARWGRLEKIATPLSAAVFVDYAHTDDALEKALLTLREITPKRLIVVFGCGGDRDRGKRPAMGAVAARLADLVILTSDNPRTEDPMSIIDDIVAGLPASCRFLREPDRRKAIRTGLMEARAGDTLLIAGKGHETYQEYAHRVVPFDDREEARTLAHEIA